MINNVKPVQIVVLAAGHGKRMGREDLPKVLVPLKDKPIISHLLKSLQESGVDERPVIVVGQKSDLVKTTLGDAYDYIYQDKQLGTGHAVTCTKGFLIDRVKNVLVLYGDHPFVSALTIKALVADHQDRDSVITMATVKVSDFADYRSSFFDFGRIVRSDKGDLTKIIERKDAAPSELQITEVNPGYYCFKAEWLWENLSNLKNNNNQNEYYLTDLVGLAVGQGHKINTIEINSFEALGINTPAQLELLNTLI